MRIRPARAEEFEAVGALTVEAYVADGLVGRDDWYAQQLADAARRAKEAELLVAVDHVDGLLGSVTFCLPGSPWAEVSAPGEAEFRMLAVAPAARGRGVGTALARWCVDRAREQGAVALAMSSHPDMVTAHRIYERMGFVRAPERDWKPSDEVSLIAYVLDLRP